MRVIMFRLMSLCTVFLFLLPGEYANGQNNPVANPAAVVVVGDARFTILTPCLIRMEWSAQAQFEDHASLVFINRRLPVPKFETKDAGDWRVITTDHLQVRYKRGSGKFSAGNLEVRFVLNGRDIVWKPGLDDTANLGGTTRTLDGAKGAIPLEPGLLSRNGWVVVDDSQRPLFDESDWPWVMPRPQTERQDLYFLG